MPLPISLPHPVRILGSLLALFLAVLWLAPAPAARAATVGTHAAAVPLERVSNFGANPGALNMYVYRPAGLPAHPAVVVALHGCTQSAQVYADNSGLTTLADRHGFLLVFAETTSANNFSTCFNWFQPIDNRRGQGEAASIRQMVAHAESAYGADAARTYVTGLSAGGGMTSVMLAAYPDVFEAGAVIAGLPYDCTKDTGPLICMNPGVDRTPAVWAQRVRDAYPGYSGPWPRVAIWHGDRDSKVVPRNADELRDQWTAVHGVDQSPDRTSTIGPNQTRREQYLAADGRVVVEVDRVPAIGHGTPVDPGSGSEQCGQTGTANFIDSICSSYWITAFFGLDGSATVAGTGTKVAGVVAGTGHCHRTDRLRVPGAERQVASCLDELTTAGTVASGHTDQADWAGLTPAGLATPRGVPGIQIDGYFPDTSTTNTNHGWHHDAQFVVRLPDRWNGGLVVAGSPGVREQYANDRAIGDWALSRGYAFAATDKGNTGAGFHRDGAAPGEAIAEWNDRLTELTRAARAVVAQRYHHPPSRTLATGMSNGGYLVRWQLENHPELYDGGVDWEGTLWRASGPNLLTFLPPALRHYPVYAAGGPGADEAHRAMLAAGYPAGSEFLWPFHHQYYWDLTQRIYREELDPAYDGPTEAGTPYCAPGTPACDADYDYASRPPRVHRAVASIGLTGRIGKPLITLHGTLDVLLPIARDSDVYARMVRGAGRGGLFRYYRVDGGTHVDSLYDAFPDRLRPLTPCHRSAFTALEAWIDRGSEPPPSHTLARPADAGPGALLTDCPIGGTKTRS